MTRYGYARVSDSTQEIDSQVRQLMEAGAQQLISEVVSGTTEADSRPGWAQMMGLLRPADTVIVTRLDRIARSLDVLLRVRDQLRRCGVTLVSLADPATDGSASGDFAMSVLGAASEFERRVIKERQAQGIAAARKRGVHLGRSRSLSARQINHARAWLRENWSVAEIADALKVSRATVRAALRGSGAYSAGPGDTGEDV